MVHATLPSHLNEHDEEEYAACDVDLLPEEHHGDAAELPHEVDDDEEGGEEPAAAPGYVHVLPLLAPLNPHAHPILEKCGNRAESRDVRQDMFGTSGHLLTVFYNIT